ncbi:cation diffusion facilitator family transporter [Peptoniphilus catoniae]|uniref:cation diffusion facilitator family transporter n=1 Tax=Peptoniphilus catoniae TaxID=1660341 RepID=UPI001FE7D118|nr:cation diffusion facilitator family transporter [Peptoniphilus catoniae]
MENRNQDLKEGIILSMWTFAINFGLGLIKVIAGLIGSSSAMMADGMHSFSDCVTTVAVIFGLKISAKDADKGHPYGHEKFELVFAKVLSVILFATALKIGYDAVSVIKNNSYSVPGLLPLGAALVSILTKEIMYRVTIKKARKIKSVSMEADAWHHRSDALSSVGAFFGIMGARLGFPILDPITGILVSLIVMKVGIDLYMQSVNGLVDESAGDEVEKEIVKLASSVPGVVSVANLRTRTFGSAVYADIAVRVDGDISVTEGHDISTQVHNKVEHNMNNIKHIMIHIEPADEKHTSKITNESFS